MDVKLCFDTQINGDSYRSADPRSAYTGSGRYTQDLTVPSALAGAVRITEGFSRISQVLHNTIIGYLFVLRDRGLSRESNTAIKRVLEIQWSLYKGSQRKKSKPIRNQTKPNE